MVAKEIDRATLDASEYFREAKLLYEVEHDHIVPVRYACLRNDRIALVMPYYKRGTLAERIEDAPLTQTETIHIGIGLLRALGHIHSKNIVHFDVKPSNVLFADCGRVMLSDFGVARPVGLMGTTQASGLYMLAYAPENLVHWTGSVHTDIYQAGLLLYRTVNGDPFWKRQLPPDPFGADWPATEARIKKGKLPKRDLFMPHVHGHLKTVIRKALAVNPTARYQTPKEFRRVLARVKIPLDWSVTGDGSGTTEWRLRRPGQPDLVVEKKPTAKGKWSVDVFTFNVADQKRRARSPDAFQRPKLETERDADKHLTNVFRTLGSPGTHSASSTRPDDQVTRREAAG